MPARFCSSDVTITWQGIDDTTPAGHSLALGRDSIGTVYLWLFEGDQVTDDAFVGSVLVPDRANQVSVAYDFRGSFVGTVTDVTETLEKLVALASKGN